MQGDSRYPLRHWTYTYRESDESAVARLWWEVFPDSPPHNVPESDIQRKLAIQREQFIVGELSGRIIATAMATDDDHRGWVYYLAVLAEYRRFGYGQAMMVEAERRLPDAGCTKVNLMVHDSNRDVVGFYEGLGYRVEPVLTMGKLLKSA